MDQSPADLKLLCDQAVQLHQKGELAAAEKLYLQILERETSHFAARHLLGVLRYQQERGAEALAFIAAALEINPGSAEAHSNCGAVLKSLGRLEESLAAYDRALALSPELAVAHNGRGATLSDLNRFEEALVSYNKALAIMPDFATALGNRGQVLQYLGRLDAARADFQRALTLDPGLTNVYLDYVDLAPIQAGDPLVKTMESLAATPLNETGRLQLDFALAKAYGDLGDHDAGFRRLLSGNARKRARIRYDETAALGYFGRIQSTFTPELLREKEKLGGGSPSAVPIFILGMMRSGSTLVEQILASHPQVHGAGELRTLTRLTQLVQGPGGNSVAYPEFVPGLDAGALRQFVAHYLAETQRLAPGASHITDKMPENFFFAGLIHLILPNARIIHTVRDPVDTCVSCFSRLFTAEQNHTYELGELGRYYRRYQKLMAHWWDVLPPGRMLEVRYEEVVADLETQARRIIAYCGLEWDPRCLSFHATERPVRTSSVAQVRQPLYPGAVGRAHRYEAFLGPLRQALAEG
jgi:tetratricopeptide (TPR) repeat protein